MSNALKGVLLSALVLPGLGQFVLKRRLRGALIMLAVVALLGTMIVQALGKALTILENIDIQVDQVDISVIQDAVRQATTGFDASLSGMFILGWFLAAVDAYLLGKKLDRLVQARAAQT